MKFTVTTAGYFYDASKLSKYEDIGFTFKGYKDHSDRAVIDNGEVEVELNTLDDLMAFSDKFGQLVVSNDPPSITIYDDYME